MKLIYLFFIYKLPNLVCLFFVLKRSNLRKYVQGLFLHLQLIKLESILQVLFFIHMYYSYSFLMYRWLNCVLIEIIYSLKKRKNYSYGDQVPSYSSSYSAEVLELGMKGLVFDMT